MLYNISSSWLHSVWQSLGPSMFLQITLFHSFRWLSSIPLHTCTTSSLAILCQGTFRCSHVFAIVNRAAVNLGVHVSFWIMFLSGSMPRSAIAQSYGSSIFIFLHIPFWHRVFSKSKALEWQTQKGKHAFFHPKLVLVKGIHLEWVNAFIIYSAFLSILSLCPISTFVHTT